VCQSTSRAFVHVQEEPFPTNQFLFGRVPRDCDLDRAWCNLHGWRRGFWISTVCLEIFVGITLLEIQSLKHDSPLMRSSTQGIMMYRNFKFDGFGRFSWQEWISDTSVYEVKNESRSAFLFASGCLPQTSIYILYYLHLEEDDIVKIFFTCS